MSNQVNEYDLSIDKKKNRMLLEVRGFITTEMGTEMIGAMMKKASQLENNAGLLIDLRDFNIGEKFENLSEQLPGLIPTVKYIADVLGTSHVGKLQVSHYTKKENFNKEVQFFDDMDEAIKWLDLKQGL